MPGSCAPQETTARKKFLRDRKAGLLMEYDHRRKPAVDSIDERPVVVPGGVDERLEHFWKRKSGIEAVRPGLQVEGRIQRTQSGKNRERGIAEAFAELPNLGRRRDGLFL